MEFEIKASVMLPESQFELMWNGVKTYHRSQHYYNAKPGDVVKFLETTPSNMPIGEPDFTGRKIYAKIDRVIPGEPNTPPIVHLAIYRKLRTRIGEQNMFREHDSKKRVLR